MHMKSYELRAMIDDYQSPSAKLCNAAPPGIVVVDKMLAVGRKARKVSKFMR